MVFKPFSHISRNAALAKSLWTGSGNQGQPAFFVSTTQFHRHQSQVVPWGSNCFGQSSEYSKSATSNSYPALGSTSSFTTLSALTSLDDERQKEVVAEGTTDRASSVTSSSRKPRLLGPVNFTRRLSSTRDGSEKETALSNDNDLRPEIQEQALDENGADEHLSESSDKIPDNEINNSNSIKSKPADSQVDAVIEEGQLDTASVDNIDTVSGPESSEIQLEASEHDSTVVLTSSQDDVAPSTPLEEALSNDLSELDSVKALSATPPTSVNSAGGSKKASHSEVAVEGNESTEQDRNAKIKAFVNVLKNADNYNQKLSHIASQIVYDQEPVADLSQLLNTYAEMLSSQVPPNQKTYEILIPELLKAAYSRKELAAATTPFPGFSKRHGPNSLSSIGLANEEKFREAESYFKLAINLYSAGNTIKTKHYNFKFTLELAKACIEFNDTEHLSKVIESFSTWNNPSKSEGFIVAVRGLGLLREDKDAKIIYNKYKTDFKNHSNSSDFAMYSAMVTTLLACSNELDALQLFKRVLETIPDSAQYKLKTLTSAVINGFSANGDLESCWKWIRQFDDDINMPKLDITTICSVFSKACFANKSALAEEMFDYMAIQQESRDNIYFNDARNNFLMMAVNTGNTDLIFKGIKELLARNGTLDEITLFSVVRYLFTINESSQVFHLLSYQVPQLYEFHSKFSGEIMADSLADEFLSTVVDYIDKIDSLNIKAAVSMLSLPLINVRAFSKPDSAGIKLLKVVWGSRSQNPQDLFQIYDKSSSALLAIIKAHTLWIQSTQSDSLGTLAISSPIIDELRENFSLFVNDIVSRNVMVPSEVQISVTDSLTALEDSDTAELWNNYISKSLENVSRDGYNSSNSDEMLVFNLAATSEIIALAHTKDSLQKAFSIFEKVVMSGNGLIEPDGIISLFMAANNQKLLLVIAETYRLCLSYVPFPGSSYKAWDIWNAIHRGVVQYAAELDYSLALQAYMNLIQMGSSPDATGYGQLIANAPSSSSRDETSDAVRFFNEAQSRGIAPNTFLYNVVLSKLSKARRFKECMLIFEEMDREGVKKSSVTYGTMISACCRAGEGALAANLFDEMERSPSYVPRIAPFNIMLQYYVHTVGDRASALAMYQRLRSTDLNPSAHTYKLLMDMYSTIQPVDLKAADEVLLTILKDGNMITTQHYAALIVARGVALKDFDSTVNFYESIKNQRRIRPDKIIFQALLESYVVNRRIKETTSVLNEMMKYGVELNAYMANVLIRGWALLDLNKSVGLFNHVLETNLLEPSSYESIIKAFLFHNDMASAYSTLTLMRSNGYPEPVVNKVDTLIGNHLASGMPMSETSLLVDSIFRQDSVHRLGSEKVPPIVEMPMQENVNKEYMNI